MWRRAGERGPAVVLGLCIAAAAAGSGAAEREPPAGGHPLAGRSGSLADLLEQPDWGSPGSPAKPPASSPAKVEVSRAEAAPRPQPGTASAPPPAPLGAAVAAPPSGAIVQLLELVRERHAVVDRASLFKTLDAAFAAEAVALKAQTDLAVAVRGRTANNRRLLDLQKQAADKAAAVKHFYERLEPEIRPWITTYLRLRGLLEPERADDVDDALTAALEKEIERREDFFEGRILAALRRAFRGDEAAAGAHLEKAGEAIVKYRLFLCPMAHDCCHAWLLLGRPSEVNPYVERLKKLDVKFQTPERCRLVAVHQAQLGRYLAAKDYFDRALRKAATVTDEGIIGDAALFYLAAGNDEVRQPEKGAELLGHVENGCSRWEVIRARAAAAAERGEWRQAATLMEECVRAVPAAFRDDAASQRKAYEAQGIWHARSGTELRSAE